MNIHPFELGNVLGMKKGYEDNHFLLKMYSIDHSYFNSFYSFHLEYFLNHNPSQREKAFFAHVWSIVSARIIFFETRDPFSRKHPRYVSNIQKLEEFRNFLSNYDHDNMLPQEILIKKKDALITELQSKLDERDKRLKTLEQYEVSLKIMIQDNHLPTFIDLIHQIKELTLPGSGRKLLKSDYDSPYYKLISKYFSHQGKDIPVNTARNYFVQKSAKDATKGSKIPDDKKLFSITAKNGKGLI
ncbi:hypothetical protein M8998_03760 [Sphingobacterium sp. lm-10]|uniref:hypothetical protein n=1 Tax=Sphingobacterium sp. lm-10 TaxID=2944904 RepID=UPI0020204BFA|nr:hypothetical protein [Sphingobacterium sp. lm-10]MCL7987054.1 hypothetical protein [Sphingobacterium sp. lm-10]